MNPQVGAPQVQQPQNPYIAFLNQLRNQSTPQAPGQTMPNIQAMMQRMQQPTGSQPGGAPVGQPSAPQGPSAPQQPDIEDAALPGQNPGTTKQLLGAMNQLHQVITQLTDPQEIRMIRTIILMLNQLIQRDQQVQNTKTGQATGPQGGGQGPAFSIGQPAGRGMSTGQPAGAPNPAA